MNVICLQTAARIRTLHAGAQTHALAAVAHAIEAGGLLAEAKATLAHGEFQNWVTAECGLNPRTAQRYMRAHAHRDALPHGLGLRAALEHVADKSDTVSHLQCPAWLPDREAVVTDQAPGTEKTCWFCWRDTEHPDFAHALRVTILEDDAHTECTKRPILAHYIGDTLKMLGLPEPDRANWQPIDRWLCSGWREAAMEGAQ